MKFKSGTYFFNKWTDPVLEAPTLGGVWGRIFPGMPYPCNNCREAAQTQDLLAPVG
jgi:hypothetical protein